MQKMMINEVELAERWNLSPKTLQRWRSEGRPGRPVPVVAAGSGIVAGLISDRQCICIDMAIRMHYSLRRGA